MEQRPSCCISVVTTISMTGDSDGFLVCGLFHNFANFLRCLFWVTVSPSEPVSKPSAPWSTEERRELRTARSELAYTVGDMGGCISRILAEVKGSRAYVV